MLGSSPLNLVFKLCIVKVKLVIPLLLNLIRLIFVWISFFFLLYSFVRIKNCLSSK